MMVELEVVLVWLRVLILLEKIWVNMWILDSFLAFLGVQIFIYVKLSRPFMF